MVRSLTSIMLAGALLAVATPVFAAKVLDTQVGKFDLDPFNVLAPAEPPAPDKPAPKKHHAKHHKKKM